MTSLILQHIIYNHAPFFVRTHGSLSVWSTQGMEKTHYMARTGYFKHTRHGGGQNRANSLLELHQWNYRRLFHRANQKALLKSSPVIRALQISMKQRRQISWHQSSLSKKKSRCLEGIESQGGEEVGFILLWALSSTSSELSSSN